jgi:hypothetical protein
MINNKSKEKKEIEIREIKPLKDGRIVKYSLTMYRLSQV